MCLRDPNYEITCAIAVVRSEDYALHFGPYWAERIREIAPQTVHHIEVAGDANIALIWSCLPSPEPVALRHWR